MLKAKHTLKYPFLSLSFIEHEIAGYTYVH